ncbi:hypothetical protein GCM10022631_17190 [Deinococcus rubellus]|uniref:VOC family protein n=1 Tax=Deinococcus rubellus TaxID=1889240 RepID=A0ABY5YIP3_9DEIO|nr:VOC family protein [Deinococcus rubellus]UWX64546.1 VOC family protein [Deinococcus rubellus]
MKITALELACHNLEAQKQFYAEILGLTLLESSDSGFSVQVGRTRLTFRLRPERHGVYHFAFNIPENQVAEAKSWIQQRAALLEEDGNDEFTASAAWNARMFYFRDPDGNILECIARHRLANASSQAFGPASLLNVSEIGWPVGDVQRDVERLQQQPGLSVFGTPSSAFTPLGDDEGLLIVVELGRPWFPTAQAAAHLPLRLTLADTARDLEPEWEAAPGRVT